MAGAVNYPIDAPSMGELYSTPYGVLTKYIFYNHIYTGAYKDDVDVHIDGYSGMDAAISIIINLFETAAKNEEAREKALFQAYINLIPEGTRLRADFDALIQNKQYSQAFDTLQKTMQKMYDFDKTLEENQKLFAKNNDLFLTGNFLHSVIDQLGRTSHVTNKAADFRNIDLSITGEMLISNIIDQVRQQAKERLKNDEMIQYEKYLERIADYIREIFIDSYGITSLQQSLQDLEKNQNIIDKRKEAKYSNVPLNRLIYNQVYGLLNGMGLEVNIDLNGGGAKTGKITGTKGMIKSDDIILMTTHHTLTFQENPNLKEELQQLNTKYDLDEFLQRGDFKDNFIIMTSAKDQSFSSGFNNKFGKNAIKFAEQASLNERIADIRMFANSAGAVGPGINDLIFALVNLESDMVCAGEQGAVKQALGVLCVNWMFDDLGDVVLNVSLANGATKICVYNINGWYYTLSDILHRTVDKIRSKQKSDLVAVKLSIPKTSSYATNVEEGMARWEATRNNIMSNTTLGFDLKVKNLFNAFYT